MNYKITRAWGKDLDEIEDVSNMKLEQWEIDEIEEWDRQEAELEAKQKKIAYLDFTADGGDPNEFESYYEDYE